MSGEKMDGNHAGVRQSKGAGLRIDTKAAELAALPTSGNKPTSGEKLYTDYIKTHYEFRKEHDNLDQELRTANERADAAEVRIKQAENHAYQTNKVAFSQLKQRGELYQKEFRKQQNLYTSLRIRCDALEQNIGGKNQEIEELKWELEQERQISVVVRSEYAKTVGNSDFGSSFGRE